jgi:hypothetical protein
MLQLNPPLVRVIVGGPGWAGPTGKGVANLVEPGHRDDDIVWIIDLDENGQTWCVPNRYVRAPRNITYGRKSEPDKPRASKVTTNAKRSRINGNGHSLPATEHQ